MQSRSRYPGDATRSGSLGFGVAVAGGGRFTQPYGRGPGNGNFSRGGRSGNHKPFYPPPPPPPPQPSHKFEILMEAGRLAAEYLVAKGALPPNSLHRGWATHPGTAADDFKGQYQENRTFFDRRSPPLAPQMGNSGPDMGPGRRRFDDDYNNPRSRRNGRGKRKFGFYKRGYSDWGQERDGSDWGRERESSDWGRERDRNGPLMERSRGYSDSHSFEDDEDGAPGYRREQRGVNDEVGSSVSGVAGGGPPSKVEAMGESELEDTGSKVSSSNVKKDPPLEMEDDANANKMHDDSKVSTSEVEQVVNGDNNNATSCNNAEEPETKHSPETSDGKAADDKASEDKASDDKIPTVENNLQGEHGNLLKFCEFAKVPTRLRSSLAHRNAITDQSLIVVDAAASEEATQMVVDEAPNEISLTNLRAEIKNSLSCQEHANPNTAGQTVESVLQQEKEASAATATTREENSIGSHDAVNGSSGCSQLSPLMDSHEKNLKLQGEEETQICKVKTPPQDEDMVEPVDQGKLVDTQLFPNIGGEPVVAMEEEKLDQPTSFKICDLNLVGSPEVTEIHDDPDVGRCAAAGPSMESQNQQPVDIGVHLENNDNGTNEFNQLPLDNKAVPVIDLEDDCPVEVSACDSSKPENSVIYPSMENIMNPPVHSDVLPGIQDGYNLVISDYLGPDISCYPSMQSDLQEGITGMDDVYGSLSDIGFMGVWDQPNQDYEKYF